MSDIEPELLKQILEGAIMAAGRPLSLDQMQMLFVEDEEKDEKPAKEILRAALEDIQADCRGRGYQLKEVASGWRFQVVESVGMWVSRLWEEKPQKYSRALLETLALIAYRQPLTRGDIEEVRGVAVSSNIIKTLMEREWVKVVGHRDVPGRPALYATTRHFLDYFNLKSLEHLPTLAELKDFSDPNGELQLQETEAANEESINDAELASQVASAEMHDDSEESAEAISEDQAAADEINAEEADSTGAEDALEEQYYSEADSASADDEPESQQSSSLH